MKKALGKGLRALIPEGVDELLTDKKGNINIENIDIESIKLPLYKMRDSIEEDSLSKLAKSIKEIGVIQPIVVRNLEDSGYELIVGHRRLTAAKYSGMRQIPAIVKEDLSRSSIVITALIENIQRQQLNPIEEAKAYKLLSSEFGFSHESIAEYVGKDRTTVTNYLRLLKLPEEIKEYIAREKLSLGHAKVLLGVVDEVGEEFLVKVVDTIIERGISVRETESLIRRLKKKGLEKEEKKGEEVEEEGEEKGKKEEWTYSYLKDYEEELMEWLGTKVNIKPIMKKKGTIEIEYYTREDLDRIIQFLVKS